MKKLLFFLLPLLLIFTACGEKTLDNAAAQRFCSVEQGFDFYSSRQARIGYLTYLKIGDVECPADFEVSDPTQPANKIKTVGVFSWLSWKQGKTDAVVFAAQVSTANKDRLVEFGKTDLTSTVFQFAFALYDYDSKTLKYYVSLSSNSQILQGTLHIETGHKLYYMSEDSGVAVSDPVNFNFQLGVDPTGAVQKILLASAPDKSSLKNWGGK